MKSKCSICKQQREIEYQGDENNFCKCCWETVNAPFDRLLNNGKQYHSYNFNLRVKEELVKLHKGEKIIPKSELAK
ncbi:hypothetical protein AB0Y20_00740 [Heyndrickxia oleronia]|uniref:hypothetical protein n=1 Tax=Heyndrickxia oleronia TaxID=38875 RepID=UPI003F26B971